MKERVTMEEDKIEAEFVDRITSLFSSRISEVILFGSRAKGISKPGSDYDFLIVLKEKDRRVVDEIYNVVTDFLIKYGADISLKIYRNEEFQRMASIPTPFIASVLKTGKKLWSQKSES